MNANSCERWATWTSRDALSINARGRVTQRLFVYGSLRQASSESLLATFANGATFSGRARVRGRLYRLGDYPGLVCTEGDTTWVQGEVFTLDDPPSALSRLDDYEGCGPNHAEPHEFERVELEVTLESGETQLAWVYLYRRPTQPESLIESGDYCDDGVAG